MIFQMQIRLKERKVKLEKYIRTVEMFQGTGREIETKIMGISSYVSVEIVVTDLESVKDELQHVQVSTCRVSRVFRSTRGHRPTKT